MRKLRTESWGVLTLLKGWTQVELQKTEKAVSQTGKSAICTACQDNRGRDVLLAPIPQTASSRHLSDTCRKKIWLPPKPRQLTQMQWLSPAQVWGRGRGLPPGAVCCGDKDLFSRGRKVKYHQRRGSVNVYNDPNLHFRETGERTRKVKGFARWMRQSWHSNS